MPSSAAPRPQRHESERERGQGGLGRVETARHGMATRRRASGRGGEVVDDGFAENPLPPLCFLFISVSVLLLNPVALLEFI